MPVRTARALLLATVISMFAVASPVSAQDCQGTATVTTSTGMGGRGVTMVGPGRGTITTSGGSSDCFPPGGVMDPASHVQLSQTNKAVLKSVKLAKPENDSLKVLDKFFRDKESVLNRTSRTERDRALKTRAPGERPTDVYRAYFEAHVSGLLALQSEYTSVLRGLLTEEQRTAFDANLTEFLQLQATKIAEARKNFAG